MNGLLWVTGLTALGLLAYLFAVLLFPEEMS
jgi:K+-transporting ATPase KdpF subunit